MDSTMPEQGPQSPGLLTPGPMILESNAQRPLHLALQQPLLGWPFWVSMDPLFFSAFSEDELTSYGAAHSNMGEYSLALSCCGGSALNPSLEPHGDQDFCSRGPDQLCGSP